MPRSYLWPQQALCEPENSGNSYCIRVCDPALFSSILLEKGRVFNMMVSHFRMTLSVFQEKNKCMRKIMKSSILIIIFVRMANTKNV